MCAGTIDAASVQTDLAVLSTFIDICATTTTTIATTTIRNTTVTTTTTATTTLVLLLNMGGARNLKLGDNGGVRARVQGVINFFGWWAKINVDLISVVVRREKM